MGTEQVSVDDHFFDDLGADSMLMARFCARVRKRADLPSVSIRTSTGTRRSAASPRPSPATSRPLIRLPAEPAADCERRFAEVLADIVGTEHVPVDGHFFDDLGADSMLMARFCARVRKRADLPSVSMQGRLPAPDDPQPCRGPRQTPAPTTSRAPAPRAGDCAGGSRSSRRGRASSGEYVLCGALQLLFILGYPALAAFVAVKGYEWVSAGPNLVDIYLRAVVYGSAMFLGLCTVPILLKWVLIGRWKPQQIRVWSLAYFRFWLVKTLIQLQPDGAVRSVHRSTRSTSGRWARRSGAAPSSCPGRARVHRPAHHRRRRGDPEGLVLHRLPGPRRRHPDGRGHVGKDALVGEATVLDIGTSMGDGAQLGHSSSLHAGQAVPDGERWHGSPAQPTDVDYQRVPTARRRHLATGRLRGRAAGEPAAAGYCRWRTSSRSSRSRRSRSSPRCWTPGPVGLQSWAFYRDALVVSAVLFFGAVLARPSCSCGPFRALLNLLHHAGQGLPAVRVPLLGPPRDRPHDQQQVLHASVR